MSVAKYNKATISIHWLVLLLMVLTYCTMEFRGEFARGSDARELVKMLHYWFGMTIFFLTFIRMSIRFRYPYPAIEPAPAAWQHKLAGLVHGVIYLWMITMPILGWLILSAEGKPVPFWGLELPMLMAENRDTAKLLEEIHELLATFGYALLGFHALAAIVHHHVMKDTTLLRMKWR